PLVEYRREGHELYTAMLANFEQWMTENAERIAQMAAGGQPQVSSTARKIVENLSAPVAQGDSATLTPGAKEPGRNDPCPCGSGLKYKKCGLIGAPEHKK